MNRRSFLKRAAAGAVAAATAAVVGTKKEKRGFAGRIAGVNIYANTTIDETSREMIIKNTYSYKEVQGDFHVDAIYLASHKGGETRFM